MTEVKEKQYYGWTGMDDDNRDYNHYRLFGLTEFLSLPDIQANIDKTFSYSFEPNYEYHLINAKSTKRNITIGLQTLLEYYWSSIEDLIDLVQYHTEMPSLRYYCFCIQDIKTKKQTFCYDRDM